MKQIIKSLHRWLSKAGQPPYTQYIKALVCVTGGYIFLLISDLTLSHTHITLCAFKWLTGMPCPGCGMGRATLRLLHGDIAGAWQFNILCLPFTAAICAFIIGMLTDLFINTHTTYSLVSKNINLPIKAVIYALLLISWVVNILRGV